MGCKFHLYLRKFSMFMIVSPKILNLHDSLLYCHFENNKNDISTTGLMLPSQACVVTALPWLCSALSWKTCLSNNFLATTSTLIVGGHFLKSLQSAPVVFNCGQEFPKDYLVKLFLRMTMYTCTIEFENRKLESPSNRKSKKCINVVYY